MVCPSFRLTFLVFGSVTVLWSNNVEAEKGGSNIIVHGKSGHEGGGSVVVNSNKKGPQNIVIRDYRGTVVLNSQKKGGANIVINDNHEKKPHHHHPEHHHPEHHHSEHHHGHHQYPSHLDRSSKLMPMLGESGTHDSKAAESSSLGSRSESTRDDDTSSPSGRSKKKRKSSKKKKSKLNVQTRVKGEKDDYESETAAYPPSVGKEEPYSSYKDGPGPLPQADRKGLRELEQGVEYGVEQQVEKQIEQQIESMFANYASPDSGLSSDSADSNLGPVEPSSGDESHSDAFGLSGDSGHESPLYFSSDGSSFLNEDALKGLSLSDSLFADKDSSNGPTSDSGLYDLTWPSK